jgi:hypothetical protein
MPVRDVDRTVWPGRIEAELVDPDHPATPLPQLPSLSAMADQEVAEGMPTPILDAAWERLRIARDTAEPPTAMAQADSNSTVTEQPTPAPASEPRFDSNLVLAAGTVDTRPTPWEDWTSGLDHLRAIAHQRAAAEHGGTGTWTFRDRLLSWMAESSEDSEAELWEFVLSALASPTVASTESDIQISEASAGAMRKEVNARERQPAPERDELKVPFAPQRGVTLYPADHEAGEPESQSDASPFQISEFQLCARVLGFGRFDPLPVSTPVNAGMPTLLYWEVAGPRYEGQKPNLRSRLHAQLEIVPMTAGAAAPIWRKDLGKIEDICRRSRHDYYVNYRLMVPASTPPGKYSLRLRLHDEVSGRYAESSLPIWVGPAR